MITGPRILFDISTLLRHWERADGITRTLSKFAAYALEHVPETTFVYLGDDAPLRVKNEYVSLLLTGKIRIDTSHFRDPGAKMRVRDRLPSAFKSTLLWFQRPRRQALLWLERIAVHRPQLAQIAQHLRPSLLNEKYQRALTGADGTALRLIPHDIAFSAMDSPTERDVLVLVGSDWSLMTRTLSLRPRPKTVAFCHDIIPLLFPQFFTERNVDAFRHCAENLYARADLLCFSGKQIASDTVAYLKGRNIIAPPIEIVALGADDTPHIVSKAALPEPLATGQFALFVSTIEPRKNHRVLFEAWKALLAEGVPQRLDFKLVFVGRKGWMVDELWHEMTSHPGYGTSLIILSNVDDETLGTIYDQCAFTAYPSLYEGFGLPIIESFRHGKPVISSSAGALPETVDGFSPCLSPTDEIAWRDTLRLWIENPAAYSDFENRIKVGYRSRDWDTAAEEFFQIMSSRLSLPPPLRSAEHRSDKRQ